MPGILRAGMCVFWCKKQDWTPGVWTYCLEHPQQLWTQSLFCALLHLVSQLAGLVRIFTRPQLESTELYQVGFSVSWQSKPVSYLPESALVYSSSNPIWTNFWLSFPLFSNLRNPSFIQGNKWYPAKRLYFPEAIWFCMAIWLTPGNEMKWQCFV